MVRDRRCHNTGRSTSCHPASLAMTAVAGPAAFLVFRAGAPFRLAASVFFLAEADASLAINSPAVGSVSMLISILLLWPRLRRSGRSSAHIALTRPDGKRGGTFCGRK